MNPTTGKAYGPLEATAALSRGEQLVSLYASAEKKIKRARQALAEKLRAKRKQSRSRARAKLQKASRRANR